MVVASALLSSCASEPPPPKGGDIIKARTDDQFADRTEAMVALPTGRLLVRAGEPVRTASADQTRARESVDAPSGAVLVPVSWQYDPWDKGRLDRIFRTSETPRIDLVSEDQRYRLPPPDAADQDGSSFYVVVEGDADDSTLEIEFDGVTQTVDLTNAQVDEGDAADLYDIDDSRLVKQPCDDKRWFDGPTVVVEFVCDRAGPVLTPYAAGQWAPAGSLWLAVAVELELRSYNEANLLGGGARYLATHVEVTSDIDDAEPVFDLSTGDNADTCPVPATRACGWSRYLVFEVPADDGEQGPLDLEVAYQLRLAAAWGGMVADRRNEVEATESLKIWKD